MENLYYDSIKKSVDEILGKKVSDEQIEKLAQSLLLIIKKHQNYLFDYLSKTNQDTLFHCQQNSYHQFPTINIFLPLNYANNGFNPNFNYPNVAQNSAFFPVISPLPLIPFPNPPITFLHSNVSLQKSKKKKEKTAKSKIKSKKQAKAKKEKKENSAKNSQKNIQISIKESDPIFKPYIEIVEKQLHPDVDLSSDALTTINTFLIKIFKKIAFEVNQIAHSENKNKISTDEIQRAIKSFVPGDLLKFSICEGEKAIVKFNSNGQGDKTRRAGLIFNVEDAYRILCNEISVKTIDEKAAVYLCAVLEYLCAEVSELAGNACRIFQLDSISSQNVEMGIDKDDELKELQSNLNI